MFDTGASAGTAPTVTAIVPTYNRAHFIGESLDSLLGQTVPPVQVIVVDDGSTDATAAVLARYAGRIETVRQDNAGKASAINRGLAHATGDAIWVFDDDDIAVPDAIERLAGALAADPNAAFAFGGHAELTVGDDGAHALKLPPPGQYAIDDLFCALLERCFIFQGGMLVRRAAFDAVGPFDAGLARAQDYEMLVRLARRFAGVAVDGVMFHQRQHSGVRGTAADSIPGTVVWERQKAFDAEILTRTHAAVPLDDYLPRGERGRPDDPAARVRGLLRRGAVMARKKLWRLAGDDLAKAAALAARTGVTGIMPRDAAVLGRVFDEWGYARDELDAGNPLLRGVAALPPGRFADALMAALTWPLFRYIALSLRDGKVAAAARYVRLYAGLRPVAAVPRHLGRLAARKAR